MSLAGHQKGTNGRRQRERGRPSGPRDSGPGCAGSADQVRGSPWGPAGCSSRAASCVAPSPVGPRGGPSVVSSPQCTWGLPRLPFRSGCREAHVAPFLGILGLNPYVEAPVTKVGTAEVAALLCRWPLPRRHQWTGRSRPAATTGPCPGTLLPSTFTCLSKSEVGPAPPPGPTHACRPTVATCPCLVLREGTCSWLAGAVALWLSICACPPSFTFFTGRPAGVQRHSVSA